MKSLNKGDWVYHRYKKRLGFVLGASSIPQVPEQSRDVVPFATLFPLEPVGWVKVLFVGDDTPHDAYANFLERVEDNNEKTN